jgi:hypothetical protein
VRTRVPGRPRRRRSGRGTDVNWCAKEQPGSLANWLTSKPFGMIAFNSFVRCTARAAGFHRGFPRSGLGVGTSSPRFDPIYVPRGVL